MRAFLLHSGEPAMEPLLSLLLFPHGTSVPESREKNCTIIHWGAYHPDRGHAEVLQPIRSILLAQHRERAAEVLRLHGLECELENEVASVSVGVGAALSAEVSVRRKQSGEPPVPERGAYVSGAGREMDRRWAQEYVVPVFHLQALTLFHRAANGVFYGRRSPSGVRVPGDLTEGFEEVGTDDPNYYAGRAIREAIKAIYALGLDYGVVRIGIRAGGSVIVRSVEPVPQLTERLAELFAEAMNRLDDTVSSERDSAGGPVMLGADPEFLLLTSQGKVKFASNYAEKEGPFGCDAIVLESRRKIYPLAELRPKPSTDVRELVVNLHRTMQIAAKQIGDPELRWVAGGMPVRGFPLGGHIHFSGVELNSRLLRVFDNYLALPLTLLEDESTGLRKPRYGFLGDFRRQRHGGFEYRVLPSWMVSPTVAKGVLALAKLAAEHYRQLNLRPLADVEVARAYYQGDKLRIRPLMLQLWRDVERLPGFAQQEAYLLPLRRLMLQMQTWKELEDIRPKWKIPPFS
ncbi:putative amidoligase domain-containing protein [Paenibacillus cremeus]|uniref:Phage phiEco32-like COOH.NH2 ligase-type 2 n=1 Tax=Paenibacillus cremeus TaxID=2163881 RepID=A0A559JIG2_9BACL|nr:hypothetical protein [Paenibacillus cremeus]TVX99657.1 hypothetical protein FPZ49_33620 [Paenibacillus cremeus]